MEKVEKIEKVDGKIDVFAELCESLRRDYEETFRVMENGTINASNDNIRKVQEFLKKYNSFFRFEGIEVNDLDLESAGHRQIKTVNKTKKEMMKLLGVANHMYMKSCKVLKVQPSSNHISAKFT